jgi:hypothetical protein
MMAKRAKKKIRRTKRVAVRSSDTFAAAMQRIEQANLNYPVSITFMSGNVVTRTLSEIGADYVLLQLPGGSVFNIIPFQAIALSFTMTTNACDVNARGEMIDANASSASIRR